MYYQLEKEIIDNPVAREARDALSQIKSTLRKSAKRQAIVLSVSTLVTITLFIDALLVNISSNQDIEQMQAELSAAKTELANCLDE